jgi:FSR family fosmidomycin resistance protein-like MFS transporter
VLIKTDGIKGININIILCFSLGHAVMHFMGQSFSVLLPFIQEAFLVTPIQIGVLITVKELVAGVISLPGGILSDYLARYRAHILSLCFIAFGAGWLIVATAQFYGLLIIGIAITGGASSIWHLPSLAELGSRFSANRGTVFAIHGAGGSVGDIIGPMATGLLLAFLSWREIIAMYVSLPLILAIWTFLLFTRLQKHKQEGQDKETEATTPSLREQLQLSKDILSTTHIWRVNIVAGLRGMCFTVLVTFLPLYMYDSGFSSQSIGFHFGLLWALGLLVSPYFGHLSDRFGRKIILVPALLYSSALITALAFWGKGPFFTILIVLLGLSIRSDYSLINATILDIVKNRVETTMLGILSLTRFVMGAAAPLVAGILYQYIGMQATLLFVSVLFLLAAIIFSSADLQK